MTMPPNMGLDPESLKALQKKSNELTNKIQDEQKKLMQLEKKGEAGAGLVKVTLNGVYEATKVEIDPALLKEDVKITEELVAAAINDAVLKVRAFSQSQMLEMLKEVGLAGIQGDQTTT